MKLKISGPKENIKSVKNFFIELIEAILWFLFPF
ncbi:hypothetical protein JOC62_001465 [Clostridium sardiniense]|nr:hypothetical protein [Clostridium sardiniense]MDQ0461292.1 hypothetical protein [Clostridium sardiniense]